MLPVTWFVEPALSLLANGCGEARPCSSPITGHAAKSSDEQFEALMEGSAAVAVTAIDNVLDWNRRIGTADFRVIAQIERTTPIALVAQPAIAAIGELRGRTLLVDAPHNGFVVALRDLLDIFGLPADAYTLEPAGGGRERYELLTGGTGDATLLISPFDDMAVAAGCRRLANINEHFPSYPGQGLVVRRSAYPSIHLAVAKWLAQLEQARIRARTDTAAAAETLSKQGVPPPVARALIDLLPASLIPSREGVDLLCAQRRSAGLGGGDAGYAALVDLNFIENMDLQSKANR